MPQSDGLPGSQQNTITGSGNIITGGQVNHSHVTAGPVYQVSTVQQLRDELDRVRQRLVVVAGPTAAEQDALQAVELLQHDIAQDPQSGPDGLKRLGVRLKGLLTALTPVAELIGGVAALEEILHHLGG